MVTINAWNVHDGGVENFGPFEWVQVTYDLLRVPEDTELAAYRNPQEGPDYWEFFRPDGTSFRATDFTIATVKGQE